MLNFIIYRSGSDVDRKITVVNGQPFYQSSGYNSGYEGTWLPCLFLEDGNLFEWNRIDNYIDTEKYPSVLITNYERWDWGTRYDQMKKQWGYI